MFFSVYERLKKFWAYGSATVLWFASQLGLVDAPHVEAKNIQPNDSKLKASGSEPIYLEKTSTIQSSLEEIFATDNLDQMAHYSQRSHSSYRSHSSHSVDVSDLRRKLLQWITKLMVRPS